MQSYPFVSREEAIREVRSGMRVFVHGAAATPEVLLEALVSEAPRLRAVELIHLHTEGRADYADPKYFSSFRVASLFTGANLRHRLDYDRIDYLPCFLSEIPDLFRSGRRPIDIALIHVSPPDKHGLCSLGVSVDIARAAVEVAGLVIAQVNPHMPRVHGDALLPIERIHRLVSVNTPLPEPARATITDVERRIGGLVAGLVEDGATLQVGIGSLPDAVLASLHGHRNLGVHTETWSDGMLALIQSGAVDNSRKAVHAGHTVSSFITGSREVYDFIDDNPEVIQLEASYVNSPQVIARNPRMVAINSAVEVDLTGQVCADSVGPEIISGVGGQMDFIRGASLSKGGKPIIALPSRTKGGAPRIVATLKTGAGVVTTRAHVHYVVTEYGVADLYGRTLGERAKALIEIAHPDDRACLDAAWRSLHRR